MLGGKGPVGDAIDALVVGLLGDQRQAELLAHHPAKKPHTECCCQPVAFMMTGMVVPLGLCSMLITVACFDPARPPLASVSFIGILHSATTASRAVTTEAPQRPCSRRGEIPSGPKSARKARTVTLCSRRIASLFWIILWLVSSQNRAWNDGRQTADDHASVLLRHPMVRDPAYVSAKIFPSFRPHSASDFGLASELTTTFAFGNHA
jgi:hypothetical protein